MSAYKHKTNSTSGKSSALADFKKKISISLHSRHDMRFLLLQCGI